MCVIQCLHQAIALLQEHVSLTSTQGTRYAPAHGQSVESSVFAAQQWQITGSTLPRQRKRKQNDSSMAQSTSLAQTSSASETSTASSTSARSTPTGYCSLGEQVDTEISWTASGCKYGDEVSRKRRGQLIRCSQDKCLLYTYRVSEILLDGASPNLRIRTLIEKVIHSHSQLTPMDPCSTEFIREACRYIRILLLESNRVETHAQRQIGCFIKEVAKHPSLGVSELRKRICNHAAEEKKETYFLIRDNCSRRGCSQCSEARQFHNQGSIQRHPACTLTQELCRLNDYKYENFTRVFLEGCGRLARLPDHSPLLCASDPQGQLRELVTHCEAVKSEVVARGLPTLVAGTSPVFPLATGENPVEAVQYIDGDGGFIVSQFFPGLLCYLNEQGTCPPSMHLEQHGYDLLPFREEHHDAIELGHEYRVETDDGDGNYQRVGYLPLGYEALVAARGNLSRAQQLWVVPNCLDRFEEIVKWYFCWCSTNPIYYSNHQPLNVVVFSFAVLLSLRALCISQGYVRM